MAGERPRVRLGAQVSPMTSASKDAFVEGVNAEESAARRVSERVVSERAVSERVVSERVSGQRAVESKPRGEPLSELMREVCATGERRGVRVVSPERRGHVFFDSGHVVHAEFGEDVGLRALLEMLRSSSLELQPCARPWPGQPSLFLSAEVVFAALGHAQAESSKVATEVRRRVQVPPGRPPSAPRSREQARAPAPLIPPLAIPGVAAVPRTRALPVPAPPGSARAAALKRESGPGVDRTPSADAAATPDTSRAAPSRTGNVFWARPRPAPSALVIPSEPLPPVAASRPVRTLVPGAEAPPTTMVRLSARGVILAARGEQSERLADAAAFIHNQAKLIAADLGRHGRTAVHLRGGGFSLLVVKSEVNDVAAALGSTERLKSLLRKVGFG